MVFSQNTDVGNCRHWQNGDINLTKLGLLYCLKAPISCGCGQGRLQCKEPQNASKYRSRPQLIQNKASACM